MLSEIVKYQNSITKRMRQIHLAVGRWHRFEFTLGHKYFTNNHTHKTPYKA